MAELGASEVRDSEVRLGFTQPQDSGEPQSTEVRTEIAPTISAEVSAEKGVRVRKDKGRLHAVRHGVLARHPLEALRHLGEDCRALRRLEKRCRAELKPRGLIAELIFDRFWCAYLRCLLAARVESSAFLASSPDAGNAAVRIPALIQAELPTLVVDDEKVINPAGHYTVPPDVLQHLALVQRYDRYFGREMYQAMALLLLMRAKGKEGLEHSIAKIFGTSMEG